MNLIEENMDFSFTHAQSMRLRAHCPSINCEITALGPSYAYDPNVVQFFF